MKPFNEILRNSVEESIKLNNERTDAATKLVAGVSDLIKHIENTQGIKPEDQFSSGLKIEIQNHQAEKAFAFAHGSTSLQITFQHRKSYGFTREVVFTFKEHDCDKYFVASQLNKSFKLEVTVKERIPVMLHLPGSDSCFDEEHGLLSHRLLLKKNRQAKGIEDSDEFVFEIEDDFVEKCFISPKYQFAMVALAQWFFDAVQDLKKTTAN